MKDVITTTTGMALVKVTSIDQYEERYWNWMNDKQNLKYSENRHKVWGFVDLKDYLSDRINTSQPIYKIYYANLGYIGNITADIDYNNLTADMGILIGNAKARGCGAGFAAWDALMQSLFEWGIRKVEGGCMATNTPMIRIFEKSGMTPEGSRKGHFLVDGEPVDMVYYGRMNSVQDA